MGTRVHTAPARRRAARLLAIVALSASPVSAFAVVDCEQAGPTMEAVRRCVLDQQQKQVDSAYRSLARKLRQRNPDAASQLAKSQTSWADFAGDTCDYVKTANLQQTIPSDAWLNCWVDFSQARVRILKKWEAQLTQPN
ncbi:urocanate hydratase [Burkholderia sp. AU18528]|uniref:lysozyme inhibitor LprI family protein n=1 Tax=Burkholderia sp. AU18528 TaxID=2015350 RepID=UPI000C076D50|nr:lysozyme inhibitor LprI family protein [Burkholderia sp. AU18528]PHP87830.1 urocanate hydratase [Burkholderia sp. AU18528]